VSLRKQIGEFLAHEETPVDSIIGDHAMLEVLDEVMSLLDAEPEAIMCALGFVRDAARNPHSRRNEFRECLVVSDIWDELRRLLCFQNFWVRKNAIYTIGKLAGRERACLLSDSFPYYLETDPINIPPLLKELRWLTGAWNWSFVEQTAAASHYLQRWSLCSLLDDDGSSPETFERYLDVLSALKTDPNSLVANEASLRVERIKLKLGPKLPKPEWRLEVKRIARLEPRLTFERATMQFMREKADYAAAEFDVFVDQIVAE
jgi:hypothetical protein